MREETEFTKRVRADMGDAGMKRAATHANVCQLIGILMEELTAAIRSVNLRIDKLESAKQEDN